MRCARQLVATDGNGFGLSSPAFGATLAGILREFDPGARPVPLLLPGVTDGRFFAKLGIQTYGFLPMQLPEEMRFMDLVHAEDERIPVEALDFGTRAIRRLIERLGPAPARTSTTWAAEETAGGDSFATV